MVMPQARILSIDPGFCRDDVLMAAGSGSTGNDVHVVTLNEKGRPQAAFSTELGDQNA